MIITVFKVNSCRKTGYRIYYKAKKKNTMTCVSGQHTRQFQPCASTFFFFQFNSFATVEHILSMVHIRKDLTCIQPIEVAYYSADSFPAVCCHCASGEDLLSGPESKDFYPICHTCRAVSSTHPILKRKRKLTR